MSYQLKRATSVTSKPKILNQFARLEQQLYLQEQTKKLRQSRLCKIKSKNQLILADDDFIPQTKLLKKDIKSAIYSQVHYQRQCNEYYPANKNVKSCIFKQPSIQISIPSKDYFTVSTSQNTRSQKICESLSSERQQDCLDLPKISRFPNPEFKQQDFQYCEECDSPIFIQKHVCLNKLNNIGRIHQSIQNIGKMSKKLRINRFDLVIYSLVTTDSVAILCQYLKMTQRVGFVQLSQEEQIIKMRIQNAIKKKILCISCKKD